ncbi:MAG: ThiF family adenylyltransferase [Bdellovibrionales bacterium]
MKSFTTTKLAAKTFTAEFDKATYLERTRRNRYWLGSEEGQMRLQNLRVGIAGLGGMGSNIAEILVRLGVGHIKIADPDTIEASNINRQVIANRSTLGQKKALASAAQLREVASDYELVVYDDGITEENAKEFVSDLDVVIDEIDVSPLAPHVWLHREAQKKNLPIYSGFIIGMGTHIFKYQGTDYTFEDFMGHQEHMYKKPTLDFIYDRFFTPRPSYLESHRATKAFLDSAAQSSFPIFGASTFGSQSCLVIRMVCDVMNLTQTLGVPPTPVMPKFIKLDPLDFTFKICDVENYKVELRPA